MKVNKFFFYIKHLFKMCFYNKFRFLLSVIGLFVGLFVFTTGNILIDSYYNENRKNAAQMDEHIVALRYESEDRIDKQTIINSAFEAIFATEKTTIFAKKYQDDLICSLSASIVGVSNIDDVIPIQSTNGDFLITKSSLLKGRFINGNDIALSNNVIVIDEFTESLLFPNGNSIGSSITLDVSLPGISDISNESETGDQAKKTQCVVIGVIKNCYFQTQEKMRFDKFCKNASESIQLNTIIYCPISYVNNNFEISPQKFLIWNEGSNNQKIKDSLNLYKNQSLKEFSSYNVIDRSSVVAKSINELKPMKVFLTLIMLILLIISGINAMNIMFFSIKERINEIGIKKALGATKLEILNQFIIEGMIMSFISSIMAIIIACLTVLLIQTYLNEKLFVLFEVVFTPSNLLLPILVAFLYGFIFSVIPSYYGARIKVTDSLRFE